MTTLSNWFVGSFALAALLTTGSALGAGDPPPQPATAPASRPTVTVDPDSIRAPSKLPPLVFEPPTRGYGQAAVAYGRSIGAYGWPTMRNYMVRGGDKKDYTFDERKKRRFIKNIDEICPPEAPACFLDLEDHVKTYNMPDTTPAMQQHLIDYNMAIVQLFRSKRPNTLAAVWNHPNRQQVVSKMTNEWRRRQWAWAPVIREAGMCSANCFIWWNDVERDLAWMVPYLELCLEIAGHDVPVYVTVYPGQQGKMNPVTRETLVAIWTRLAQVEWDGKRISGFDLYMTYKAKNPEWTSRRDNVRKKGKMTPEQAAATDERLKWSMDTLWRIMQERDGKKVEVSPDTPPS